MPIPCFFPRTIHLPRKMESIFQRAQCCHQSSLCGRLPVFFYLFLFLALISIIFSNYARKSDSVLFPDTIGYLSTSIAQPWAGLRTPGFPLYLQTLGALKPLQDFRKVHRGPLDKLNALIHSNAFVNRFFRNLRLANTGFLAWGLTFLSFALAQLLPAKKWPCLQRLSAGALIISTRYGMMVSMDRILADTLALILVPYVLGALLLFFHSHKSRWLVGASLLAAYFFLVKPAFAFFPFLCGLICSRELGKNLFHKHYARACSALLTGGLLTALTLAWPLWLFWHGGIFVPSQLVGWNNFGFVFFSPGPETKACSPPRGVKKYS